MLRVTEEGGARRCRSSVPSHYRQLARSLIDLQRAADRVFDAISQRTAEERDKLHNISCRIQVAKAKIDALSRSKEALTIRSPSRYPSSGTGLQDLQPLFHYEDESSDSGFPITKLLVQGGLHREFGEDGTLELFRFFSEANIESLSLKVHSKVEATELFYPREDEFLDKLCESSNLIDNSFLEADQSALEDKLSPKNKELPPPPPSLLQNNALAR